MATTRIPKRAFIGLTAVAWADGSLRRSEHAALLHAAKQHGLEGEDLAEVERATKEKLAIEAFDPGDMTEWERVLTYAIASWLAQLDGVVTTEEHDDLVALSERLGISKAIRDRATAAAFDIAVLPESRRPERYDFAKLETRLREKLPQLAG